MVVVVGWGRGKGGESGGVCVWGEEVGEEKEGEGGGGGRGGVGGGGGGGGSIVNRGPPGNLQHQTMQSRCSLRRHGVLWLLHRRSHEFYAGEG